MSKSSSTAAHWARKAAVPGGDNRGHGDRMSARHVVILGLVALATAPLCLLLFSGGRDATAARPTRATTPTSTTIEAGCVERALAYGLTNDEAQGEQNDRMFLSPLLPHPPLPRPGFYAPGHGPDQGTLFHAFYHGYVVVRYRSELADAIERRLSAPVRRAAQPVVLVAGDRMPFAAGALVYGRTTTCGTLNRATLGQLAGWIESARINMARP
jgi:hypothetical protein